MTASDKFVRINTQDSRYLELSDGTPYIPIGFNLVPGPDENEFESILDAMKGNGVNYCRIWLDRGPWDIEDTESGIYSNEKIEVLNRFLSDAGKKGIYVKPCIEYFRDMPAEKKLWSDKIIHHEDNGGPFTSMEEFLNSPEGKKQFIRKLEFYRDRCPNTFPIFAWELWNEVNCVNGDWQSWTAAMLPELHRLFPENLAVQSLGSFDTEAYRESMYAPLSRTKGNDLAQVHRYLDPGAPWNICHGPVDMFLAQAVQELRELNPDRPVLVAETGAVEPCHTGCSHLFLKDRAGMILHDAIFAPFFAGSAGTGNFWFWRQTIQTPSHWHHFARFAKAVEGIDPGKENFKIQYTEQSSLRIYILNGAHTFLAWCRDSANNWKNEIENGISPEILKNIHLDLTDYVQETQISSVECYDPWKNCSHREKEESASFRLPPFERSIVIRIRKQQGKNNDHHI